MLLKHTALRARAKANSSPLGAEDWKTRFLILILAKLTREMQPSYLLSLGLSFFLGQMRIASLSASREDNCLKTSQLDFRFWNVLKRQGIVINVWVSSLMQETKRR